MSKGRRSRRKPGLWFSAMRVEVEDVKPAHRKVCCECGLLPLDRRLKIVRGSGRHAQTEIRCILCGLDWFQVKAEELGRAKVYLEFGEGEIRE